MPSFLQPSGEESQNRVEWANPVRYKAAHTNFPSGSSLSLLILPLALAVIPGIVLLVYFYRQDKARPEPKGVVFKAFLAGVISIIPAVIAERLMGLLGGLFAWSPLFLAFFEAFLVAGLVEESMKLAAVRISVYRNKAFDEVADGVVYTVAASLGFAVFENIIYVMRDGSIGTAILRAFTAVPMHAIASGIMGYYLGKAKVAAGTSGSGGLIWKGLLLAVLIHGWYDFVLFAIPSWGILPALTIIPLLLVAFFRLRALIRRAASEDAARLAAIPSNNENTGIPS